MFEHAVPGIGAGAFTTSLAFAAVMLADFRGVQELGPIAAGGMILVFRDRYLPPCSYYYCGILSPWTVAGSSARS